MAPFCRFTSWSFLEKKRISSLPSLMFDTFGCNFKLCAASLGLSQSPLYPRILKCPHLLASEIEKHRQRYTFLMDIPNWRRTMCGSRDTCSKMQGYGQIRAAGLWQARHPGQQCWHPVRVPCPRFPGWQVRHFIKTPILATSCLQEMPHSEMGVSGFVTPPCEFELVCK